MDYLELKLQEIESLERKLKTTKKNLLVLDSWKEIIKELPVDSSGERFSSVVSIWEQHILVQFNPHTYDGFSVSETAESLRSEIQRITGEIAQREFNNYLGSIQYHFNLTNKDKVGKLKIVVNHGKTAPGCEIKPIEEVVTRYEMVCPK